MATDEGFASSSALALVLGSRRGQRGGREGRPIGRATWGGGKNRGGREEERMWEGFAVRGFSRV